MKAFLSIKYFDDMRNKEIIEKICFALEKSFLKTFVFARDVQNYKKCTLTASETMKRAFSEIESSDLLVVEASEISIGVGIEAGYAYSLGIPIYLVSKEGTKVSNSIKGIAKKHMVYKAYEEISGLFT